MDARDPLIQLTREVEARVPFFTGRVSYTRRQLKAADKEVTTIAALRLGCITLMNGITGVQTGARPSGLSDDRQAAAVEAAVEWWQAVAGTMGGAIETRESSIASAPAVLAALGALGHPVLAADPAEKRRQLARAQLAKLSGIDWRRGPHWEGIAGKLTPRGTHTVGGSKEAGYAIFEALNDEASPGFQRVRRSL